MFVLACALRTLDRDELVDLHARDDRHRDAASISAAGPIADKHCIGGVPGNRTTMIVVPILAALGVTVPKTSSRAITSPAGTADTMAMLAEVALRAGAPAPRWSTKPAPASPGAARSIWRRPTTS